MEEKEIFILGAGFSRAVTIGKTMPLLQGLTKDIKKEIKTADKQIQNLWKIYIKKSNIGNIKSRENANFEDIMTFLSSDFAYEDYKDQHLKAILYRCITDLIVKIFERSNQEKIILQDPWLHSFAKNLHNKHSKVFTFNYDLVLENLLAQTLDYPNYDFDPIYTIKTMDNSNRRREYVDARDHWERSIKLYKLHGSINWLYDPEFQSGVKIVSSYTPPQYRQGLQCLIVPPTMLKNFELKTKLLDFQWHVFKENLTKATRLYIIGYSIPPTDVATRFLLHTYLNPQCEVYIVSYKPKKGLQTEWVELFFSQNKKRKLEIHSNGFSENSAKTIGLI